MAGLITKTKKKERWSVERTLTKKAMRAKELRKNPKVSMEMPNSFSEDGNAWAIMGMFQAAAVAAKWSRSDINEVLDEAMSSDYDYLRKTILNYMV